MVAMDGRGGRGAPLAELAGLTQVVPLNGCAVATPLEQAFTWAIEVSGRSRPGVLWNPAWHKGGCEGAERPAATSGEP